MKRAAVILLGATVFVVFFVPVLAQGRRGVEGSASGERGTAFTIGVLRRDGVVLPFAAYDGRRWQAPWPADLTMKELPISLDSVDRDWWGGAEPPRSMTLWADGKPRGDLQIMSLTPLPLRCGRRLGLRTNYYSAELPPPPMEQPYPKDGLVVSGPQTIAAIETVPPDAGDRSAVTLAITEEFDKQEDVAAGAFSDWRHPVNKKDRRKIPIVVEAVYRAPMDEPGWTAHYVEAVRRYPATTADDCGLLTSARGWLKTGPKGRRHVDLGAQITYCDRYGVSFMLPLGLFKVESGTYWVYQIAGYEREAYLISKPTPRSNERILAYPAVLCPMPWY